MAEMTRTHVDTLRYVSNRLTDLAVLNLNIGSVEDDFTIRSLSHFVTEMSHCCIIDLYNGTNDDDLMTAGN